jgi:hypothetical protein
MEATAHLPLRPACDDSIENPATVAKPARADVSNAMSASLAAHHVYPGGLPTSVGM